MFGASTSFYLIAPPTPTLFGVFAFHRRSPFITGVRTPSIRCLYNSSSFHPCMHWKGPCVLSFIQSTRDFLLYNFSHSLYSKLHLGTLLLLAPVVSLQYLVGSYEYSCTIFVYSRAISVFQIPLYSLLMFDSSSSCHNTYPSQNKVPIFIPLCISLSLLGSSSILPSRNHRPNLTSLEKSPLHQILDHTEPNCSPCAVILLVFTSFITNCYIYENSVIWMILQLRKFPGKIRGVTLVPLKTQSPS